MDFSTAFDLLTDCYIYGSIIYVFSLFIVQLSLSFLALVNESQLAKQTTEPDFYEQVKELLNPYTETVLELDVQPSLDYMTIPDLPSYIK